MPRMTSAQRNTAIGRLQLGQLNTARWRLQSRHHCLLGTAQHHSKCYCQTEFKSSQSNYRCSRSIHPGALCSKWNHNSDTYPWTTHHFRPESSESAEGRTTFPWKTRVMLEPTSISGMAAGALAVGIVLLQIARNKSTLLVRQSHGVGRNSTRSCACCWNKHGHHISRRDPAASRHQRWHVSAGYCQTTCCTCQLGVSVSSQRPDIGLACPFI